MIQTYLENLIGQDMWAPVVITLAVLVALRVMYGYVARLLDKDISLQETKRRLQTIDSSHLDRHEALAAKGYNIAKAPRDGGEE